VVKSGKVSGSVVAIATRSFLVGPSGPVTTSKAHQSWLEPSRKVRVTLTHLPACSWRFHLAARAASWKEPIALTGCHHACETWEGQYVAYSQVSQSLLDPTILPVERIR
jgi:hypothetical protein